MPTVKPPPIPEDKIQEEEVFEEIIITNEIKHITDLIDLSNKNIIKPKVKYSVDLHKLKKIVPHLEELNNMIGMEDIKKSLSHQLMYFLQGFEFKHMLHTIIEGPPGVGKTCLGKLLGQIYLELGCINSDVKPQDIDDDDGPMNIKKLFSNIFNQEANLNQPKKFKFKIAKRSDLVGQYVGHTAVKTQKVINESFGGVLFIDEAYSLGGDDVFSKECINTINQNLSENGDKFICIIAGYADALENSFFSQNSGLHRRFPFRYNIEKYNGDELAKILKSKILAEKYTVETSNFNLNKFIEDNKESFPNYGGDIETYFFHIKIMHSTRVFGKSVSLRNIFIKDDFTNALKEMKKHEKKKEETPAMYT
jgi:DNA polymerase III delta prime subunit